MGEGRFSVWGAAPTLGYGDEDSQWSWVNEKCSVELTRGLSSSGLGIWARVDPYSLIPLFPLYMGQRLSETRANAQIDRTTLVIP
jgi:hypothetical protein